MLRKKIESENHKEYSKKEAKMKAAFDSI